MDMKYGQIAESSKINDDIYAYFEYISENDRRKFVRKFREQPHEENQVLHTLRELILGAYLASSGLNAMYDCQIDGKTPDWVILNDKSSPEGIVELINFHTDKITEQAIERQLQEPDPQFMIETSAGPFAVASYWQTPNNERLYQRIKKKSDKYEHLIKKYNIPYVVSVFGEIKAGVKAEEIHQCLFEDYGGLFKDCPTLSGVLFFKESASGTYVFEFTKNPHAMTDIVMPSGSL